MIDANLIYKKLQRKKIAVEPWGPTQWYVSCYPTVVYLIQASCHELSRIGSVEDRKERSQVHCSEFLLSLILIIPSVVNDFCLGVGE